jgi:DNA-directed RNA polymerase specialized sigma24 family protein
LDDADQLVIVLHYLQGLSYREMGDITGQPVGTIKWRTSVALERLGDMLARAETRTNEQAEDQNNAATAGGRGAAADPAGA